MGDSFLDSFSKEAEDSSKQVTPLAIEVAAEAVPVPVPAQQASLHSVPDSRATEIVELMVYNRGENIISDHKPVRALMGIKYRR